MKTIRRLIHSIRFILYMIYYVILSICEYVLDNRKSLFTYKNDKRNLYDVLGIESIEELKNKHCIFAWDEVLGSKIIKEDKDKVVVYFHSPAWTWEHLCGRGGFLHIDKKTKNQIYFEETIMN